MLIVVASLTARRGENVFGAMVVPTSVGAMEDDSVWRPQADFGKTIELLLNFPPLFCSVRRSPDGCSDRTARGRRGHEKPRPLQVASSLRESARRADRKDDDEEEEEEEEDDGDTNAEGDEATAEGDEATAEGDDMNAEDDLEHPRRQHFYN